MSLQVWLPLTKDLRQQGLSNVMVINNGATFNSTGKLGGCYYFNRSSSNYLKINNPLTSSANGVSMAFWVKLPSNGSVNDQLVHIGNGSGWTNNRFTCFVRGGNSTLIFCCGDGTNSTQYNCVSSALTLNQWIHVTCTYKLNKMMIYLNGVLDKEYNTSIVPSFTNVAYIGIGAGPNVTEPATAYLNDVRIYDHCLSPMEVKELAKGLVLHYPLNRNGWGQENLILNSSNISVNKLNNALDSRTEYWAANLGQSYANFTGGEKVILSFDCEMIVRTLPVYFIVYNTNNKGPIQFPTTTISSQINNLNPSVGDTVKLRIKVPATMIKRDSPTTTNNFIEFYTNYGTNNFYKITNLKLEIGEIATPWCPNSADTLATTMGLNSTTEYDCSGFCNNGTRTGTFTWTSNTAKYAISQDCIGTNYIHLAPPSTEVQTIAIWANWKAIPSGQSVILVDNGSGIGLGLMNTGILCSTSGAGSSYTFSKASLVANTWYHFVVVKTGMTTRKLYINGVEQTATSNTSNWTFAVNELQLGKRSTTSDGFIGKLSDFRCYATALSADDVKSLYQNCATIDPDGTIRGQIRS